MAEKKILFIVEAMGGGVFTYIVDLANELLKTYDMYVAYSVRRQTPENYRDYFNKKIHLIDVKNFCRSINPVKDIKTLLEIKRIVKEIQPDVIHFHSSKAGVLGRISFSFGKIPLFYTPHGYSFLMQSSSYAKRIIYKVIETFCGKLNCTTISCSEGEDAESRKLNKRTVCINNGINVKELQILIDKTRKVEHPFTVFTLGRICYQKGPKQFNEIAKTLPEVKFLWIGDGELREELKAPNIQITGWTERRIALEYAVNADVFLLTSLWEGLPISLLEAMYMKKPVVVSDVIGNHDVIENGKNGFVCRTAEDFVKAINDIQKGKNYSEEAYQEVLNRFNISTMAKKYSKIYMTKILGDEDYLS